MNVLMALFRKFAQKSCIELAAGRPEISQLLSERIRYHSEREYSKTEVIAADDPNSSTESTSNNYPIQVSHVFYSLAPLRTTLRRYYVL